MTPDQPSQCITVVSGLPRSGTSLMMSMLEAGGMPVLVDGIREADEDNRRGYFEFEPVKSLARDASWLGQARGRAVKIILALLQHLPVGQEYRVILMRRDLDEVLASQQVMLERAGRKGGRITTEQLRRLYQAEFEKAERLIESRADMTACTVSYNGLLRDPGPMVTAVNRFLGGGLDEQAMHTMIDPTLYRQRAAVTPDGKGIPR